MQTQRVWEDPANAPGNEVVRIRRVAVRPANPNAATITVRNTSSTNIAFFVRPEITAGNGGNEVVPISYSDNYVSLFPGESTTITATYQTADLGGQSPFLRVRGYNVPTTSTAIP